MHTALLPLLKPNGNESCWVGSWPCHFFHEISLLIKRITDKLWTLKYGYLADYFLEMNKVKLKLKRKIDSICSHWQNSICLAWIKFWKTHILHCELDSFSIQTFQVRSVLMLINFFTLCNEICQHLVGLHNSVNQYISNDQCTMIHSKSR